MATVLRRTTKELVPSVNTPDYPVNEWIHNPDLSAVQGQPSKYWDITGDSVSLMDQTARDAVDAQELATVVAAEKAQEKLRIDDERVLKAFAEVVVDEINLLRAQHGLQARILAQLRTAIHNKIDAG